MKKLMTVLLTAGIAVGAFAQGSESVQIKKIEAAKVAVAVNAVATGAVVVKIKNVDGDLILRDRISKADKFIKTYDLSQIEKGNYQVEVLGQSGTLAQSSVANFVAEKPEIFGRVSKMEDNSYRLLVSALDSKDVKVLIYDGGKLIHTETIDNPQGLHKIYKVKQASAEGVSFKVETASGYEGYITEE
ncbi:hypothetical protein ACFOSV_02395 [Algoriphagus namhaensis]|uniref:Por secretion system C-terminal sorting domain-containing protein n=1 Tax=Algoriphagus namhaensis TaxID=915353 RepID=A0ABV8AMN7_9BACT